MRTIIPVFFIAIGALANEALCAESDQFSERVANAKKIEAQEETQAYFKNEMYPAIGPALASAMRECLSLANASTEKFTVVADISQGGEFINVAHKPKTNTATCLATAMRSFHAPPPPTCDCVSLPIVIDMAVKP
jgi:hypothetical protein